MEYSVRNLREVEDSAAKFGYSDTQEAHFAHGELKAEDTGLSYQVLRPGKRHAFAHRHDKAEEIYVVLSGAGRVKLDDEVLEVETMDAIRIAPRVTRAFEAGEEGLELLVFGPRHDGDAQMIEGDFWAD